MILSHSALYAIARGVPSLINFLALVFYSHYLAPEEYGKYALVIATVGFIDVILFQWLRLGLARFLAAYSDGNMEFKSSVFVGHLILVAISAFIGCILVIFLEEKLLASVSILVLWGHTWFELNLEFARTKLDPKRYGYQAITKSVAALSIGGTLAYLGSGVWGPLIGLGVGLILSTIGLRNLSWKNFNIQHAERKILKRFVNYGFPLIMTFALMYIVNVSDRFFITWLLGVAETGLYSVAYDIASFSLGVLMMIVNLAAYPLVVRMLEQEGGENVQHRLIANFTMLLIVAVPSTIGLIILSKNVANVFLGGAFQISAVYIIPWIALGTFLGGIKAFYFDLAFQLGEATRGQVKVAFFIMLINIVLNLLWIPKYGLLGAAWSTTLSYAVGLLLSMIWGRRVFALPLPALEVIKIFFSAFVMAAILWEIREIQGLIALCFQVAAGVLVYFLVISLVNVRGVRDNFRTIWSMIINRY